MKKTVKILSAILLLILSVSILASCSNTIDYANVNLKKYIKMEDGVYDNIPLSLTNLGEVDDAKIQEYIDNLRFRDKTIKKVTEKDTVIMENDVVGLFYRLTVDGKDYIGNFDGILGYSYNSSGQQVANYAPTTNMSSASSTSILLGQGSISKTIEQQIIGMKFGDFDWTKRIVRGDGNVGEDDVIYVTYTAVYKTNIGSQKNYEAGEYTRMENGDKFFSELLGKKVGDTFTFKKNIEIDGTVREVVYNGTINFASKEYYKHIDVTFPSDYSVVDLRGKTGTLHVILDYMYSRAADDYSAKRGDNVYTYYRGVITGVADSANNAYIGTVFDSNYGSSLYNVTIGAGNSIADFENGFIGKKAADSKISDVITDGTVKEAFADEAGNLKSGLFASLVIGASYVTDDGNVEYLSGNEYFVTTDADGNPDLCAKSVYDTEVFKNIGLYDILTKSDGKLSGFTGTKTVEIDGVERAVNYSGGVRFVVSADKLHEEKINVTFPSDYSSQDSTKYLNGASATFYVVVDHINECDMPEFTEDYVRNTLKFSSDKTGDDYIAEFKENVKQYLVDTNRQQYLDEANDQIWDYLMKNSEVKKFPKGNVEEEYEAAYNEYKTQYYNNKNQYGTSFTTSYPNLDSYIVAIGSIEAGTAGIHDYITGVAQERVKEKLVMYYICEKLDITISDEEFSEGKAQIVAYYANLYGITEDEVKANYGDESIRMLMLSNKFLETMFDRNVGNATYK
ncbi:MAG: hypothetical protein SOZ62_01895 [Eubacteriales bacterium]|nr:hypothetical protein [Eubacteriales bacterium]